MQMWCLLDSLKCCVLILLLCTPLLWLFSSNFRYYVRISFYYIAIFLCGQISFFFVVPFYGDVTNYRTIRRIYLFLTKPFHVKWEVRGREHMVSDKPYVLLCNHQSSIDLIGMMEIWPDRCVAMVKSSLRYVGLLGLSAMASGTIFIDRFNKEKARETCNQALEHIKQTRAKLWVFPEGTRNHGAGMLPFKKGAFHLAIQGQIPIVPVVFSRYNFFYSKKDCRFLSSGFVIVKAMEPISVEGMTTDDVDRLIEECRKKMLVAYEEISVEAEQRFTSGEI